MRVRFQVHGPDSEALENEAIRILGEFGFPSDQWHYEISAVPEIETTNGKVHLWNGDVEAETR